MWSRPVGWPKGITRGYRVQRRRKAVTVMSKDRVDRLRVSRVNRMGRTSRASGSSRMAAALNPVIETLEGRQLMAGDGSLVQSLPFLLEFDGLRGGLTDKDGEGT